ncbi:MAG TPA: hypothetical protein VLF20_00320 [Patescibacteria group bacterium]|nr:hypothetical protein [Patescibacteria group bacterium]
MPAENPKYSEQRYAPSRPHKRFVQAVDNAFRPNPGNKMLLPSRDGVSQIIFSSERRMDPRLYISRTTPAADGSQEFIIANLAHDPKDSSSYNANGIRIRAKTKERRDGQREVIEVLTQDRVTATLSRPAGKTIYDAPPPHWQEQKDQPKPKELRTKTRLARKYQEDPRDRRTKTVMKTAAVVTIAAALATPAANIISDTVNQPREMPTVTAPEQEEIRYVEISAADLVAVETILNNSAGLPEILYNPDLPQAKISQEAARQVAIAERLGLTVHNYYEFAQNFSYQGTTYDLLAIDASSEQAPAFDVYFSAAKEFADKYGITLSLSTEGDLKQTPLSPDALETPEVKHGLLRFIKDLGPLPEELIQTLGVQNIKLAEVINQTASGSDANAFVHRDTHDIYLEPTSSALLHEAYHVYDETHEQYHGLYLADDDPQLVSYNPLPVEEFYTFGEHEPDTSKYMGLFEYSILELQYTLAMDAGDAERAAIIQQEMSEKEVVTGSNYGITNLEEDRAEIGRSLLFPNSFRNITNPDHPILRDKAILLLARFYQENPNFVQYLADISIQQEATQ